MIDSKPTEFLGEMIAKWDAFYSTHFDLIFSLSESATSTSKDANNLTERIFMHLLLTHPKLIILNSADAVAAQIALDFPDLRTVDAAPAEVTALNLLSTYYVAN